MSFRSYLDVSNVWTNDRSTILPAEINVSGTYDFWAAFMPLLIRIFEFDAK
jgi:hypothetical protein